MCTRADMMRSASGTGVFDQEAEANRFAIELLAPLRLVGRHLRGLPELEKVLSMASELDISKQAAARRYVELHPEPLAALFCHEGRVQYLRRGAAFPWIALQIGDALPFVPQASAGSSLSEVEEVDPDDWIHNAGRAIEIAAQVLRQANGWSTVLLHAASSAGENDRD